MEYTRAISEIAAGKTLPVYLLCGDEPLLAEDILQALKEAVVSDPQMESLVLFRYDASTDDANVALGEIRTGAFFGGKKLCAVRGLTLGGKKEQGIWEAGLVDYVKSHNPDTVLALVTPSEPAARNGLKLLCEEVGAVIRCARLKGREVGKWASTHIESLGKRISPGAAWALEALSGPSLGVLRAEIDKLVTYIGDRDVIEATDIAEVCADASEVRIFSVIDAIVDGRPGVALTTLEKVMSSGEQPPLVLFLIAQNIRQTARAKHLRQKGMQANEIAKTLGVHPFVATKAYQASARLRDEDVESLYECILSADEAQKSGSDPLLTLQALIAQVSGVFATGAGIRRY